MDQENVARILERVVDVVDEPIQEIDNDVVFVPNPPVEVIVIPDDPEPQVVVQRQCLPQPVNIHRDYSNLLRLRRNGAARRNRAARSNPPYWLRRNIANNPSLNQHQISTAIPRQNLTAPVQNVPPPNQPVASNPTPAASSSLLVTCPICLDGARDPVSTTCGHIFCQVCLQQSLRAKKECPMCKKVLVGTGSYHKIFLGS